MKTISSLALGMVLLFGSFARAAEPVVELPAGAVDGQTALVVWIDVAAATPEMLGKTRAALDAALPADVVRDGAKTWPIIQDISKELFAAGGQEVVITVQVKEAADAKAAPATSPSTAPSDAMDGRVLIHLKPGTDREKFAADLRELVVKECKAADTPLPTDPDISKLTLKPLGKDWVYYDDPHMAAPVVGGKDDPALAAFNQSLNRNAGSQVRLAFRMTDVYRAELNAKSLEAPPMLASIGEMMRRLAALEEANAGLVLGDAPRLNLTMHFPDAESAAGFKKQLDGIVTFVAMMDQLGGGDDEASRANREALQKALVPLLMIQKGTDLTTSVDARMIKNINDLKAKQATSRPDNLNQ